MHFSVEVIFRHQEFTLQMFEVQYPTVLVHFPNLKLIVIFRHQQFTLQMFEVQYPTVLVHFPNLQLIFL